MPLRPFPWPSAKIILEKGVGHARKLEALDEATTP